MSKKLTDLILSLTPPDGTTIGNRKMLTLLRKHLPDLSEDDYAKARDALVKQCILARGQGRGGPIYRIDPADPPPLASQPATAAQPAKSPAAKPQQQPTKKPDDPTQVLSYRHNDTRANNPEVGMVRADTDPDDKKTWTYDPHLDPELNFDSARAGIERLIDDALASDDQQQMRDALRELKRLQEPYLNWTGKAERTTFEVDTVSLHVHERMDPASILANAAKRLKGKDAAAQWRQPDIFSAPFENLPLRQALDFYKHEKDWSNRLVTGDSLLVMNSLLTKENMSGGVQMIYFDPPYGIKYGSNFQPFTGKRDVKDRSDDDLTQEPEMIKAFRDTWELGIHSYLIYLRDRLLLARELLNDSGSVFVQISDENLHLVRNILDEIFGADNFIVVFTFTKKGSQSGDFVPPIAEHIVWYVKDKISAKGKFRRLYETRLPDDYENFPYAMLPNGKVLSGKKVHELSHDEADFYSSNALFSAKEGPNDEVTLRNQKFPSGGNSWKVSPSRIPSVHKAGRILFSANRIRYRRFIKDFPAVAYSNLWTGLSGATDKQYVVQTNEKVVERCLLMTTDPGDLVLDPTCGSGTTAVVAEKWGRRWITCDTSRIAVTLAKQRLTTASFDYYALNYPQEGIKGGFNYETVPHITLKSIANNPDIDTIYDEAHPKITAALNDLNTTLTKNPPKPIKPEQGKRKDEPVDFTKGDTLHEWEVPFDLPEDWPASSRAPFKAFHAARQAMQRRMDKSIADHVEREILYDKPLIDKSKLRISGPFSVEAVPAPTVLALDETAPQQEADATIARSGETSRQNAWRDELLKTGVRAKGGAMLRFAEFETLPSLRYIHASGSIAATGERVVVSFGPEHAALEQRQVELALQDAGKLRPAPAFVLFCAFTFDPEAAKDIDEVNWPGVTLLKAQMNTDLLTEDLKKQRSSNQSFWLMGQPEVELRQRKDGLWEVEVYGFDYFDPRQGEPVSGGKQQIAMWSLDVDYDGRSLMPHQVFFPMADGKGGWNRLRDTVRAELDEDLLQQFHGTVSLPFAAGENGRVAVKIVDDRGIESLKILPLNNSRQAAATRTQQTG